MSETWPFLHAVESLSMYISFIMECITYIALVVKLDIDRNMPTVDQLMQEWPASFEHLLNEVYVALLSFLWCL